MLFNSIEFIIFLPIVYFIYWSITPNDNKSRNLLILLSSYIFYGWWDWRFLSLIAFSTLVDYISSIRIYRSSKKFTKKLFLLVSIITNLGLLGFLKYYNFFIDNFIEAFTFFGYSFSHSSLEIILPVGISFYTFQTMSYSIDIYRGKMMPSKDLLAFSAYVSFFPQLVAGPIERATNLLPQFFKVKRFSYRESVLGLKQIVWGFFKKIVIADQCSYYVDIIFSDYTNHNSCSLILGALLFTFQIYGDFSGYSDIAIGTARLFGFDLMKNFSYPYFSRDIAEFWRRWHISLSTWFRDYVYIPLGGSKVRMSRKILNTFIIFLLSGLWHGANWTFLAWGFLNALYFIPLLIFGANRKNLSVVAENKRLPSIKELIQMLSTFSLTLFAWIFFRSSSINDALNYIRLMFSNEGNSQINLFILADGLSIIVFLPFLLFMEWIGRKEDFALAKMPFRENSTLNWTIILFILSVIVLSYSSKNTFIYFQF